MAMHLSYVRDRKMWSPCGGSNSQASEGCWPVRLTQSAGNWLRSAGELSTRPVMILPQSVGETATQPMVILHTLEFAISSEVKFRFSHLLTRA